MDFLETAEVLLKKTIFILEQYNILTITIVIMIKVRFVLGTWIVMLLFRIIDSFFLKNYLCFRYGLYSYKSKRPNFLITWLIYPLLHANWKHFSSNSIPFLIFASMIQLFGTVEFLKCTVIILLISSTCIYLFEKRNGPSIGISGLITGYFGYIVLHGYINNNFWSICLSIIVLAFYQKIIYLSLIKQDNNASNIGHFSGFISGFLAAFIL
ncbi:rhomboid family intramembrane serine protease [Flavobacteriaceae bacterium]|nr:rhomboid family intramembrane serine protease [Flavobacteriaceae bacterium]